jgi:hypothetical protein
VRTRVCEKDVWWEAFAITRFDRFVALRVPIPFLRSLQFPILFVRFTARSVIVVLMIQTSVLVND